MLGSLRGVLAGCACSMAFSVSTVTATGGRIGFSGAIVESTCGFTSEYAAVVATEVHGRRVRVACAGVGGVTPSVPQAYALEVAPIDRATGVPLLDYFVSYANRGVGDARAKLATLTYE